MPGVPRIDWQAALEHYVELGYARRYVDVAAAFGVSLTAVKEHARRNRWRRRAAAVDRQARARGDRVLVRLLAEAQAERHREFVASYRARRVP